MAEKYCQKCQILTKENENLKRIIKQQQKVIENSTKGPLIWIGNINLRWHELESWPYDGEYDPYFWPKYKWFPEYQDQIICEANQTE